MASIDGDNQQRLMREALKQSLQSQQQAQQQSWVGALGGLQCAATGITCGTTTTTGNFYYDTGTAGNVYINGSIAAWDQPKHKKIEFYRINEKAHMYEGGEYPEPLDYLRLKVSRWLNKKDVLVEV